MYVSHHTHPWSFSPAHPSLDQPPGDIQTKEREREIQEGETFEENPVIWQFNPGQRASIDEALTKIEELHPRLDRNGGNSLVPTTTALSRCIRIVPYHLLPVVRPHHQRASRR
jgi:hypothetical protein